MNMNINMNTDKKPTVIFFGTPEFAVESLMQIYKAGYEIKAVVTAPDKPAGRGMQIQFSDVKKAALELGLPVLQPEKLKNPEFLADLAAYDADIFVIIAFRMLPREVWGMPPLGTFNLHASLLPDYRGAAPINWAVINGDSETGVTTFFLQHQIDTGDILFQEKIKIGEDENVGSVYDRLMKLGADLTVKTLDSISAGTITPVPQSDIEAKAQRLAPKILKETSRIDWNKNSAVIHNLVRGMSPYPGAWTEMTAGGSPVKLIKIYKTSKTDIMSENPDPGKLTVENGKLFVDTADKKLEILEIQQQGKKKMSVSEYLLGAKLDNVRFV